jgi:beta-mannanase
LVPKIWPGVDYVDVLGIDGYNWGADANGNSWRDFSTIFAKMYDVLTALHPTAPVWVCEVGSKEPSIDDGSPIDPEHDKAKWWNDMFNLQTFPRITALTAFNVAKERDWRIESSTASLTAVKNQLARRAAARSYPGR